MEPRIQYAQTDDGVSIAYWKMGEGNPVIQVVGPLSHLQKEWAFPERRAFYERLAQNTTLLRFDQRGSGLSDREVSDYSRDAHVMDIEAVAREARLDRFALIGMGSAARFAIAHAFKHPEQVSRLVLWHPMNQITGQPTRVTEALYRLRDSDWELYTDTLVLVIEGWTAGEASARLGEYFRECATAETMRAQQAEWRGVDTRLLLPELRVPTLLLHRSGVRNIDEGLIRGIASKIPDARSLFLDGTNYSWYLGDVEPVLEAINDFLGDDRPPEPAQRAPGGLVTILFTDIESSTSTRQQVGDAKAQELLRTHNTIVREALTAHAGNEIKHTGDGIMASFTSAAGALDCAIAIQQGLAAHEADTPLRVYIGLNAGEPIAEDDDLFGTSVDLAKRICDQAQPEEILVSDVVRQLVAGKEFLFSDRGDTVLRGFEDPVKLWELRWREDG